MAVTGPTRSEGVPRAVDAALREFVNALSKASMYPAGHRFILDSSAALVERLNGAMVDRDALTVGIMPRGLLLDGEAAEPLPAVLREFAARMHRRNIGTIHIRHGISADEVATMLAALAASDADETVGRDGLRLEHARIEPISYDLLTFADADAEQAIDQRFWEMLVETAFGRTVDAGDVQASGSQLAEAMSERAASEADGAHRVYDAMNAFASALYGRGEQHGSRATERFNDVLGALSRSTVSRVIAAAPSSASRRRFLRESLELVPPALLLQLLESVADADGDSVSPQLRMLLGKIAGEAATGDAVARDAFREGVLDVVAQWDGGRVQDTLATDVVIAPVQLLELGLAVAAAGPMVVAAARQLIADGELAEVLAQLDNPAFDRATADTIANGVLDADLLQRLLGDPQADFALIERLALRTGAGAVNQLLDALGAASERSARRRLLDLLVRIGPAAEPTLLGRMEGAPWYLVRNILAVLGHFPEIQDLRTVFDAMAQPDIRVRQEALKALVRQPAGRDRASLLAIESGQESLIRIALTALGTECSPRMVGPVLTLLSHPDQDLQVLALRVLSSTRNPQVVAPLLDLVRIKRGFLRRQRLTPRNPVMLGALEVLAHRWAANRDVAAVLELGRASADVDVVKIASSG